MQRPPIRGTHTALRMTTVIVSLLIGGCGGEADQLSSPASLSGQAKGSGEGARQHSDSQSPRIKSSNIKTH
jgi:hypothetical protein